MSSTFGGFNTVVRGIAGNQLSLNTVGHNLSNAATEGYSRQSVNLISVSGQKVSTAYGEAILGNGVDSMSITRARNIYADRQYWDESSTKSYYETTQVNYDKLESIFNDTDKTGLKQAMEEFYQSWVSLSNAASDGPTRTTVVEKGTTVIDRLQTAVAQLQDQIVANYKDLQNYTQKTNELAGQVVLLNRNIMMAESSGGSANDLRDQRDAVIDELSQYVDVTVYEDDRGMYSVVSNGVSLVNGISKLTLKISDPINNVKYGITDYNVEIVESGINFRSENGKLRALTDTIAEDKGYIDNMVDIAATLMTTFNEQHQRGAGMDEARTGGINFFGDEQMTYRWDNDKQCIMAVPTRISQTAVPDPADSKITNYTITKTFDPAKEEQISGVSIVNALCISRQISEVGGQFKIAASTIENLMAPTVSGNTETYTYTSDDLGGTGDGTNAVDISLLFNTAQASTKIPENTRAIGTVSLNNYYQAIMSKLGADSEAMDTKAEAQDKLITQITTWRSETAGVDWNEELTHMIMFQQGYSACSRCLTTMDEMLDKLINGTGTVGR